MLNAVKWLGREPGLEKAAAAAATSVCGEAGSLSREGWGALDLGIA